MVSRGIGEGFRHVRLEAMMCRMITVGHQSTARAIREQTMHSNCSRSTWM